MDDLFETALRYNLAVPLKLCAVLGEVVTGDFRDVSKEHRRIIPFMNHITPQNMITSLLINFVSLVITIAASFFVSIQSQTLTEVVLNAVALEFILLLDESCVDMKKALTRLSLRAETAAVTLVVEGVCLPTNDRLRKAMDESSTDEHRSREITQEVMGDYVQTGTLSLTTVQTPGILMMKNYIRGFSAPTSISKSLHWFVSYTYVLFALHEALFLTANVNEKDHHQSSIFPHESDIVAATSQKFLGRSDRHRSGIPAESEKDEESGEGDRASAKNSYLSHCVHHLTSWFLLILFNFSRLLYCLMEIILVPLRLPFLFVVGPLVMIIITGFCI